MILSANILYLVGFIISSSALRWAMHSWRPALLELTCLDQIKCRVIARIQISTSLSGTSKFKISVSFIVPNFLLIVRSQLPTWYVNPHLKKQCSKFATTLHPNRHEADRLPIVELMRSSVVNKSCMSFHTNEDTPLVREGSLILDQMLSQLVSGLIFSTLHKLMHSIPSSPVSIKKSHIEQVFIPLLSCHADDVSATTLCLTYALKNKLL